MSRQSINVQTGQITIKPDAPLPVFTADEIRQQKLDRAHAIVAEKVAALSEPLDYLRTTVITGLQGDRARGKPIDAPRQAILDAAKADYRKVMAEELLIAADNVIANIDSIEDVDQAFIDQGIA